MSIHIRPSEKKRQKSVVVNKNPGHRLAKSKDSQNSCDDREAANAQASFLVGSKVKSRPQLGVFGRAMLGAALLWSAFPPVGLWWVGWLAVAPFASLIASNTLPGRNPYVKIWLASLIYWLGTFYFIPIPHWALWFGWIVVSLYLSLYLPLFVGIARTMVHMARIPGLVAIPTAWVGLELIRSYLFTGMAMVCLSHTQYQQPMIIQIADLSGAYTLSFAMALVGTCIYVGLMGNGSLNRPNLTHLVIGGLTVGGVLMYGNFRLGQATESETGKSLGVGLIQGSIDTTFPETDEEISKFRERITQEYCTLTEQALTQWPDTDLIIWPEGSWIVPDLYPDQDARDPDANGPPEIDTQAIADAQKYYWKRATWRLTKVPEMLVGALSLNPVDDRAYNAAVRIGIEGTVSERYFKNHLVMFGEYVPLAKWIPMLQHLPKIGRGLDAGTEAISMNFNGIKIAPTVCFETTVPQYIRRQINKLRDMGQEPDAMVNITNDGWFYGTSCLDLHLACNVFRAVEMRKPHLICANTGFSAEINDRGEILQQGPRRARGLMRAVVSPHHTFSPYRTIGDVIPISMAVICLLFGLTGFFGKRSRKS